MFLFKGKNQKGKPIKAKRKMKVARNNTFKMILHYKYRIENNLRDPSTVLHCVKKLANLDIEFFHLSDTNLLNLFRNLPKYSGKLGKYIHQLIAKWQLVMMNSLPAPSPKSKTTCEESMDIDLDISTSLQNFNPQEVYQMPEDSYHKNNTNTGDSIGKENQNIQDDIEQLGVPFQRYLNKQIELTSVHSSYEKQIIPPSCISAAQAKQGAQRRKNCNSTPYRRFAENRKSTNSKEQHKTRDEAEETSNAKTHENRLSLPTNLEPNESMLQGSSLPTPFFHTMTNHEESFRAVESFKPTYTDSNNKATKADTTADNVEMVFNCQMYSFLGKVPDAQNKEELEEMNPGIMAIKQRRRSELESNATSMLSKPESLLDASQDLNTNNSGSSQGPRSSTDNNMHQTVPSEQVNKEIEEKVELVTNTISPGELNGKIAVVNEVNNSEMSHEASIYFINGVPKVPDKKLLGIEKRLRTALKTYSENGKDTSDNQLQASQTIDKAVTEETIKTYDDQSILNESNIPQIPDMEAVWKTATYSKKYVRSYSYEDINETVRKAKKTVPRRSLQEPGPKMCEQIKRKWEAARSFERHEEYKSRIEIYNNAKGLAVDMKFATHQTIYKSTVIPNYIGSSVESYNDKHIRIEKSDLDACYQPESIKTDLNKENKTDLRKIFNYQQEIASGYVSNLPTAQNYFKNREYQDEMQNRNTSQRNNKVPSKENFQITETILIDDDQNEESSYPGRPNFKLPIMDKFLSGSSPPKVLVSYCFDNKMTVNNEDQPLNRVNNSQNLKRRPWSTNTNKNAEVIESLVVNNVSNVSKANKFLQDNIEMQTTFLKFTSVTQPYTSNYPSRESSPYATASVSTESASESAFAKSLSPIKRLAGLDYDKEKEPMANPLVENVHSITNTAQPVQKVDKNDLISLTVSNTVCKPQQKLMRNGPSLSSIKPAIGGSFRNQYSSRNKKIPAKNGIDTQPMYHVKSGPSKVFSGTRNGYFQPLTLKQSTTKLLSKNLDCIGFVGTVPYKILRTVLQKMSVSQLRRFENQNRHLASETDELWGSFVKQSFRFENIRQGETWRQMYRRCTKEKAEKFQKIAENIKKAAKVSSDLQIVQLEKLPTKMVSLRRQK